MRQKATLVEKHLSPNKQVAFLLFSTATKISFLEGQFMMIECQLSSGISKKNPYSIATPMSSMQENSLIGFYVKQESLEGCSTYLVQDIQIGDSVVLKGPVGHFFDDRQSKNYLFISTGSGIAPNFSLLQGLLKTKDYHKIAFLFGERSQDYLCTQVSEIFGAILEHKSAEYFQLFLSQPDAQTTLPHTPGYIQQGIAGGLAFLENNHDLSVFLCGKPIMVQESLDILLSLGVPKERITMEKY